MTVRLRAVWILGQTPGRPRLRRCRRSRLFFRTLIKRSSTRPRKPLDGSNRHTRRRTRPDRPPEVEAVGSSRGSCRLSHLPVQYPFDRHGAPVPAAWGRDAAAVRAASAIWRSDAPVVSLAALNLRHLVGQGPAPAVKIGLDRLSLSLQAEPGATLFVGADPAGVIGITSRRRALKLNIPPTARATAENAALPKFPQQGSGRQPYVQRARNCPRNAVT